ncbi:lymphocyte antigen 6E isoform X4 [Mustela putorius furo]|uniref:Lymphocyte antigen 6E isoform X4 n=1 Tax=Mustela putorius furo TaxID=9669 RepID=A0A8U0RST2_MUSPF|nr:lymphocyte antigen 6E isoform X4 [Mustela putorius furo]
MTRAPRGDEKDQPGGLATPPWGWAPGPSWGACQPRPGLKSDPARAPPPGMPAPRPPAGAPTPALLLLPSAPERQLCAARPFAPSSPCAPSPLEPRLRPCSPRPLEPRLRPCFPRPRERRLRPLSPARRRGHESGAFVRLGARLGELGETVDLRLPHAGNGGIADFTGSLSSALNHTEREAPLASATLKLLEAGAQCPAGP